MNEDAIAEIKRALPPAAASRLGTLRFADGVATVVLDVAGLDRLAADKLEIAVRSALRAVPEVSEVRVAMTAERGAEAVAPTAKPGPRIIAVGSGKGGVGKSTLSANLAVALARLGLKVGLVDADVYGPSQPRLMATEGLRPEARDNKLIPVPSRWGVPMLSMGHLVQPGQAIAWRGPMAGNALGQLIDADWGETDLIVIDLPPGTGDIQLTMVQKHKPIGAVIVSTPQDLALIDAARAMSFFEQAKVPLIGMVENMSGYVCPHCGEASDPFGHGGAEAVARSMEIPFLGHVPLDLSIRQDSDGGTPPAAHDAAHGRAFRAIAQRVADWLERA
jgi:ATP-binding protein involved in chromosome partitioning